MKAIKLLLICSLILQVQNIEAQDNSNKGTLRLLYLPIERVQAGGNIDVNLPTHFDFLKPFDSSTRFAPDEPSSFSSLEYTLLETRWKGNIRMESAVGFFRNHTKGDFLPENKDAIHFGLGNSQVGPSFSHSASYLWNDWDVGLLIQIGIGAHFSQWTSGQKVVDPSDWGIAGFGLTNNWIVFVGTPTWWNRWSLRALMAYNYSYSSYRDFSIKESSGELSEYKGLKFSSRAKRPVFSISLGFDLLKEK